MTGGLFSNGITVTETGSYYQITGLRVKRLAKDLQKVFKTTVITKSIIREKSSTSFLVHKFFTLEFSYLLHTIVYDTPGSLTSRLEIRQADYRDLLNQIREKTWVKTEQVDYPPYPVEKAVNGFRFKPYNDQLDFLLQYSNIKNRYQLKGCLLDSAPGSGKALSHRSDVLTPKGFVKINTLSVGDQVIGSDGNPTTITGVYPQGEVDLYSVIFEDGREEVCCKDHQWAVWSDHDKQTTVYNVATLQRLLEDKPTRKLFIPLMVGEYNGETTLTLDPWLLGVLTYCLRTTETGHKVKTKHTHLAKAIDEKLAPYGYHLVQRDSSSYRIVDMQRDTTSFSTFLKKEGIFNRQRQRPECLPARVFSLSYADRITLLQGLNDAGGSITQSQRVKFKTTSKILSKQYVSLIQSIGGIAKTEQFRSYYSQGGRLKPSVLFYNVCTQCRQNHTLFRVHNLRDSARNVSHQPVRLRIEEIRPHSRGEATCISVDAPDSLFVCSQYLLTHNTYTSLVWSRMISPYRTMVIVPKSLVEDPWEDHLSPQGKRYAFTQSPKYWLSTQKQSPLNHLDAEFFIFYTEEIRGQEWRGIDFDTIISALSEGGRKPIKLIIDESHRYNEKDTQQSQGLIRIGSHPYVSDVLSMSGTPIKAQGKETYPLFCIIDKYFDSQIRPQFLKMYGRDNHALNEMLARRLGRIKYTIASITGLEPPPEPVMLKIDFPGVMAFTLKNIRLEMERYIQERVTFYRENMKMYREDFEQYLLDYETTLTRSEDKIEMSRYRTIVNHFMRNGFNTFEDGENSKYAKRVERKIEANLKGDNLHYFRHIAPAVKYLNLKIRGEALGNVLGRARINAVVAIVEALDLAKMVKGAETKTAIYSTYQEAVNAVYAKLEKTGCHPLVLHSNTKGDVNQIVRKLDTPQYDSLATTYATLSEGTPLLMCSQLILLNSPFRDYQLKQCIARLHRRGQTSKVEVYMTELDTGNEDNISSRSVDIMAYFKAQVDVLLGYKEDSTTVDRAMEMGLRPLIGKGDEKRINADLIDDEDIAELSMIYTGSRPKITQTVGIGSVFR